MKIKLRKNGLFSGSDLFQLVWPLLLDLFLTFFVDMLDSIMVSSVNESAVSAISPAVPSSQASILAHSGKGTPAGAPISWSG